jgi:hypothetical protein
MPGGRAPSMPYFQPTPPPHFQAPARSTQPTRQARNGRYLPPMPEMLTPVEPQRELPPRYAQVSPRSSAVVEQPKGLLVRGQAEDEKSKPATHSPVAKLVMPSPEDLGLSEGGGQASDRPADWPAARLKLDSLGATFYRLEKAAEGGFRFTCALPHGSDATRQRNFESHGSDEAEAIRLALQQVETWKSSPR